MKKLSVMKVYISKFDPIVGMEGYWMSYDYLVTENHGHNCIGVYKTKVKAFDKGEKEILERWERHLLYRNEKTDNL